MKSSWIGLAVAAAVVLLASCGSSTSPTYGGGGGGGGGGSTLSLTVGNNFYSPTPDTVVSGSTVTWTWATPSNGHTVNWDTGPMGATLPTNSGAIQYSGMYQARLTTKGPYTYHCANHGFAMSGKIEVQ